MKMGGAELSYQGKAFKKDDSNYVPTDQWVIMEDDNHTSNSTSPESSLGDSTSSIVSSSSDLTEDATSSPTSSSYGPLFELSDLMSQLPIKRGLSKYYQGKSQTFASLSCVKSVEDLAKKGRPCRRKMKLCKSYGVGLDYHMFSPKATISKKTSRVSLSCSLGGRGTLFRSFRPPIPVQKKL